MLGAVSLSRNMGQSSRSSLRGFLWLRVAELASVGRGSKLKGMIAAFVWHWWIAPLLVAGVVLFILASVGGYLAQVTKDRYPHREARRD